MKLPLSALIDNKYLAVHGGISPSITFLGKDIPMQPTFKRSIDSWKYPIMEPFATSYGVTPSMKSRTDGSPTKCDLALTTTATSRPPCFSRPIRSK